MNLSGKKILICEEGLISYYGHFHSWINSIRNIHLRSGAKVHVAANAAVWPEIQEGLGARPVFTVNSWDQSLYTKMSPLRRYLWVFEQNIRVFRETRAALKQTGPVDLVLFTAVRVHHLLGLRALCAWGLGRYFNNLTVFLLISLAQYSPDHNSFRFKRSDVLVRLALKSFSGLIKKGKVVLAGDSHITCGEYEALAGVPFKLFPSPAASLVYKPTKPRPEPDGPVFAFLGNSTFDKGMDVFQDAILRYLRSNPQTKARFVIQWGTPCVTRDGVTILLDDRLRQDPRVTVIERSLSSEEYADCFGNADFIVLPYRKMTYHGRLSGVAVEAACSGKPMIVTKDTWLAWALREFGCGLEVAENSVDELANAIDYCCKNTDSLKSQAQERSLIALDYNSPTRYLQLLWA